MLGFISMMFVDQMSSRRKEGSNERTNLVNYSSRTTVNRIVASFGEAINAEDTEII